MIIPWDKPIINPWGEGHLLGEVTVELQERGWEVCVGTSIEAFAHVEHHRFFTANPGLRERILAQIACERLV